ncbi:putative ATP-dependent DNA helicase YjcD [compost metagenome]
MKERFKRFFPELAPVDFSTIHSLAFEVVREHFRKSRTDFQLIEGHIDLEEAGDIDPDQPLMHKKLILRKLFQQIVGSIMTDDQMDELTTYISFIKNKLIPADQWSKVKCDVPQAERILREYETYKRSGTHKLLIDFDDMLTIGNDALEQDRELLRRYQQRYDYVLTDESQDTSMVQHAIIEKLVKQHGNLCVVADDDQSIYSWRGAEPSYLLDFKHVYPKAVILYMEQNYRSSQDIVRVTNKFIQRNKQRYAKNMFTDNPSHRPIQIKTLEGYPNQTAYLVKEIQKAEQLAEVAVLYRNNASSISLINELDRAGVPFYIKDSDNRFFSHWVVEDMLNFMRMSFTDKRFELLEKIHTKLNGYITKQQMAALKEINNNESVFDNLLQYVGLQDYQHKQLQDCKETFQQMKGMPPLPALRVIRSKLGYEKAIDKMSDRLGFRKDYLIGILNTLEEIANTLDTMEEFAKRLSYLDALMKQSRTNHLHKGVTLSTFHSSKGLEFKQVYMIDLIEGILPSKEDMDKHKAGDSALMEEAVRLFYVGMTRAKHELELITYKEKNGEKVKESSFLANIRSLMNPPKLATLQTTAKKVHPHNPNAVKNRRELGVGDRVKHRAFGLGEIVQMSDDRIHIQFEGGIKALAVSICMEMGVLERLAH